MMMNLLNCLIFLKMDSLMLFVLGSALRGDHINTNISSCMDSGLEFADTQKNLLKPQPVSEMNCDIYKKKCLQRYFIKAK